MTKELQFTEQEASWWAAGGLLTTLTGMCIAVGKYTVEAFKKRNNNIETRLIAVEKGQALLYSKIREVNHKIDNQDIAEDGAFQVVLEKLKAIEKDEKRYMIKVLKELGELRNNKK